MQIIYLISKKSIENNFVGKVIEYLKKDIKDNSIITLIGGWKGNYEHTKIKSDLIIKNLNLIDFKFKKVNVLTEFTTPEAAKTMVDEADILYLQGGVPRFQRDFVNEKSIRQNIVNFDGVIFGESAGAMNISQRVLEIPMSEYINEFNVYDGYGLIPFSIMPHFNIKTLRDKEIIMWETDKALMSDFEVAAKNAGEVYCLPDESVVRYFNGDIRVLNNKCYLYNNGEFTVIDDEK